MNDQKTDFSEQLNELGACGDAVEWVNGRSLRKCWQVAVRADWMLWLAARTVDEKTAVLAACDCAETALKYVPEGEDRPRLSIQAARDWCEGKTGTEDLCVAADAACDAGYGEAGYAGYASTYVGYIHRVGDVANFVAIAAANNYADYADATAARAAAHKKMCRLIRKRIPVEMIEEGLNERNTAET